MKTYILKKDMPPTEPYIKRLRDLVDYSLRIDGEMTRALEKQANLYGRHKEDKTDGEVHD